MLDHVDLSLSLDKATYREKLNPMMQQLRSLQTACWQKRLTLIVVLEGWAAAGKGKIAQKLATCLDSRGFALYPILAPTPQEQQYPLLWRFWQRLPAQGNIGVFYHSWYTHILEDRLLKKVAPEEVPTRVQIINSFERQLKEEGIAIAKFWIHLSKKQLKKRLKKYGKDPLDAWRVRPEDWQQHKYYKKYQTLAEEMITATNTDQVPWTMIAGDCKRWAQIQVLNEITITLRQLLETKTTDSFFPYTANSKQLQPSAITPLSQVDLKLALSKDSYQKKLKRQQIKLRSLQRSIYEEKIPVLAIFEGWDAAGKGGAIKRLTDVLDPRSYQVHPFAAPTDEEKAHHYLWRFWRKLPPAGTIGIFDRSWYGRVLVERVERLATDQEWQQAYQEIKEFESQLINRGYILLKFWLHIDPDEQLKRFQKRQVDPFKQHKITKEDWRNREKWPLYEVAVNQMIERTSCKDFDATVHRNFPEIAPWTIIPGNNKYHARVKVIETLTSAIEEKLIDCNCYPA